MRLFTVQAVMMLVAALPASAVTILGVGGDNHLYSVATGTGATTDLGTLPTPTAGVYGDIAYNPLSGALYVVSFDTNVSQHSVLYRVFVGNPSAATVVGDTGIVDINSMVIDPTTGTMYGVGGMNLNQLYTIDQNTGVATAVGSTGVYKSAGDLSFDNSGNLYLTSSTPNSDSLYLINKATGAGTLKGSLGVGNVYGTAYDPTSNTMYGFTNPGGGGEIITINLNTGVATNLIGYNIGFYGATDFEPEPGTTILLLSGIFALAVVAYRRRAVLRQHQ
jgi:hypothetical protein